MIAALVLLLSASAAPGSAGPLPKKVLVDDEGRSLADAALVVAQEKAGAWSPAKARIDALTTVIVLPEQKDASGRHVVPDRILVAQSERGRRDSVAWASPLGRQKAHEGFRPALRPAPHVVVFRHPTPVDEAQTRRDFLLTFHVAPESGRVRVLAYWDGAAHVMDRGAVVVTRIVVDEAKLFVPTKTHAERLEIPGERVVDLTPRERALLARPQLSPAEYAALVDALVLPGEARARARAALQAATTASVPAPEAGAP